MTDTTLEARYAEYASLPLEEKYVRAVDQLTEALDSAELFKARADEFSADNERYRLLAEDAVLATHEKNVALVVLAAGFHPSCPAGFQLAETLRSSVRNGIIAGADISREHVWHLAELNGLKPDLTPILT